MSKLTIALICPSRGRPQNIARLHQALLDTDFHGIFVVGVDDDDTGYLEDQSPRYENTVYEVNPRLRLAGTLNKLALEYADKADIIGFVGDDHLPQGTWEADILAAFERQPTGFVYGNDQYQRQALPTAVFVSSNIVKAIGYMCPPGFVHMYLDNVWLSLGSEAGCIQYLEDTNIEHLHPAAGKAEWDPRYEEVNSTETVHGDAALYHTWRETAFLDAVAKIKELL